MILFEINVTDHVEELNEYSLCFPFGWAELSLQIMGTKIDGRNHDGWHRLLVTQIRALRVIQKGPRGAQVQL